MTFDESQERRRWFRAEILPLEGELLRYAARISPSEVEAEDLVQEAFLRVMSGDWRQVRNPCAVLKTTMRNYAYDLLRRRGVASFRPLSPADLKQLRQDEPDPEAALSASEELHRLSGVIAGLPASCREVFILRKLRDLPMKAIAETLGLSVSTVEKHLSRALRLCSERLASMEQVAEAENVGSRQGRMAANPNGGGGVGRPSFRDQPSRRVG